MVEDTLGLYCPAAQSVLADAPVGDKKKDSTKISALKVFMLIPDIGTDWTAFEIEGENKFIVPQTANNVNALSQCIQKRFDRQFSDSGSKQTLYVSAYNWQYLRKLIAFIDE